MQVWNLPKGSSNWYSATTLSGEYMNNHYSTSPDEEWELPYSSLTFTKFLFTNSSFAEWIIAAKDKVFGIYDNDKIDIIALGNYNY